MLSVGRFGLICSWYRASTAPLFLRPAATKTTYLMGALNSRPSRVPPRPTKMELYAMLAAEATKRADAATKRADAATKRADLAEMRYVTDMAKYHMQADSG